MNLLPDTFEISLQETPQMLIPFKIKLGFFKRGENKKIGSYRLKFPPKVFVFCWEKTIAASSDSTKDYYDSIVFEDMMQNFLPPQQKAVQKLKELDLLVGNHSVIPAYKLETYARDINESLSNSFSQVTDLTDLAPLLEQSLTQNSSQIESLSNSFSQDSTPLLVQSLTPLLLTNILTQTLEFLNSTLSVEATETQLTKLTAKIIEETYPQLQVTIESEDPCKASNQKYTPFHRSRRDITLRKVSSSDSAGNVVCTTDSQAKVIYYY